MQKRWPLILLAAWSVVQIAVQQDPARTGLVERFEPASGLLDRRAG